MCWGVDDFDEAWPSPYTNDLIRLAASVKIARKSGILNIAMRHACELLLVGCRRTLADGGSPFVLAEEETHLEKLGIDALKPPKSFWKKLNKRPPIRGKLPRDAKQALEKNLPEPKLSYRVVRREAGLGSLGQRRFVALAQRNGGWIAREAKRVVPSANVWLRQNNGTAPNYYKTVLTSAVRSPDPYQTTVGSWLIRRLSPDSNPIEIEDLSKKRDEEVLLGAMGSEVANIHLGDRRRTSSILQDLKKRKSSWLHSNAKKMARLCLQEWKEYKN